MWKRNISEIYWLLFFLEILKSLRFSNMSRGEIEARKSKISSFMQTLLTRKLLEIYPIFFFDEHYSTRFCYMRNSIFKQIQEQQKLNYSNKPKRKISLQTQLLTLHKKWSFLLGISLFFVLCNLHRLRNVSVWNSQNQV